MDARPLPEVSRDLARFVDEAVQSHVRIDITRDGERVAVLMGAEDYDSLMETLDVLSDADLVRDIRRGPWDAEAGDLSVHEDVVGAREALVDAFRRYMSESLTPPHMADLTVADADFLDAHSGVGEATDQEVAEAIAKTAAKFATLITTSLTTGQAADMSGLTPSTIRHRLASRSLYSVLVGRRRRLPMFQFTDEGTPLPGLAAVLRVIPRTWHPLSVAGFFTTPQPELELRDTPATPRTWLAMGGDPRIVAALAANQDISSITGHSKSN